jgi:transcriptional regulator with XRE-family HTH domain
MSEKSEFSQRLHAALKQAGAQTVSPTKLAIDFNLQHRGKPISTQAAHKWLNGTAIPAQDKVRTLAGWLNVSPEWLRYGDAEKKTRSAARQNVPPYLTLEDQMLSEFRQLSEAHRIVAREVVTTLLRLDKAR